MRFDGGTSAAAVHVSTRGAIKVDIAAMLLARDDRVGSRQRSREGRRTGFRSPEDT